jgi:hypothetical protein
MSVVELVLQKLDVNKDAGAGKSEVISLFFKTYDTPPSRKWVKLLSAATMRGMRVEPYFLKDQKVRGRFVGFPLHEKNANDLANLINCCIQIINNFKPGAIPLQASETTNQADLNLLHKYFEDHRGTVREPAELFRTASNEVQVALEDYNLLIHEFESYLESSQKGTGSLAGLDVNFMRDGSREPLAPEDYAYFDPARDFGGVYLHYCDVGKQVLDAYFNKDEVVGGDNIRPLQYASAAFDIFFGQSTKPSFELEFKKEFNAWIMRQGLDPRDPKLSIGYIKVAELIVDYRFKSMSRLDFLNHLSDYLDVKIVKVHE